MLDLTSILTQHGTSTKVPLQDLPREFGQSLIACCALKGFSVIDYLFKDDALEVGKLIDAIDFENRPSDEGTYLVLQQSHTDYATIGTWLTQMNHYASKMTDFCKIPTMISNYYRVAQQQRPIFRARDQWVGDKFDALDGELAQLKANQVKRSTLRIGCAQAQAESTTAITQLNLSADDFLAIMASRCQSSQQADLSLLCAEASEKGAVASASMKVISSPLKTQDAIFKAFLACIDGANKGMSRVNQGQGVGINDGIGISADTVYLSINQNAAGREENSLRLKAVEACIQALKLPDYYTQDLFNYAFDQAREILDEWGKSPEVSMALDEVNMLGNEQDIVIQEKVIEAWQSALALPKIFDGFFTNCRMELISSWLRLWDKSHVVQSAFQGLSRLARNGGVEIQQILVRITLNIVALPSSFGKRILNGSLEDSQKLHEIWDESLRVKTMFELGRLGQSHSPKVRSISKQVLPWVLKDPNIVSLIVSPESMMEKKVAFGDVQDAMEELSQDAKKNLLLNIVQKYREALRLPDQLSKPMDGRSYGDQTSLEDLVQHFSHTDRKSALQGLCHLSRSHFRLVKSKVAQLFIDLYALPGDTNYSILSRQSVRDCCADIKKVVMEISNALLNHYFTIEIDRYMTYFDRDLIPELLDFFVAVFGWFEPDEILNWLGMKMYHLRAFRKKILGRLFPIIQCKLSAFLVTYFSELIEDFQGFFSDIEEGFKSPHLVNDFIYRLRQPDFRSIFDKMISSKSLQGPLGGNIVAFCTKNESVVDLLSYVIDMDNVWVRQSVLAQVIKKLSEEDNALKIEGEYCSFGNKTMSLRGKITAQTLKDDIEKVLNTVLTARPKTIKTSYTLAQMDLLLENYLAPRLGMVVMPALSWKDAPHRLQTGFDQACDQLSKRYAKRLGKISMHIILPMAWDNGQWFALFLSFAQTDPDFLKPKVTYFGPQRQEMLDDLIRRLQGIVEVERQSLDCVPDLLPEGASLSGGIWVAKACKVFRMNNGQCFTKKDFDVG